MSGVGSPVLRVQAEGMQVAIIASSWHEQIMGGLIAGAVRACGEAGAVATVYRVPGSFELPVVAAACARSGQFDALVALGVVIRGDTPHFEYVCQAATDGLGRVALDHSLPVGFGLLTCDTEQQALARCGLAGSTEDKGAEAATAALMVALTLRDVGQQGQ
ncbi:MAG: 6,7-dimethyl-8-ribityllumazine synthase [Actinomycetales bacterium]|nr:6,7-dimethyl-8-ribityllumazine synthase [Actinomycetales bacterium]